MERIPERSFKLFYSFIILLAVSLTESVNATGSDNDTYQADYEHWASLYKGDQSFDNCINCLSQAEAKYEDVSGADPIFDNDTFKYPIMVVHLYTQEWPKIYSTVNSHLLRGSQNEVWQAYTNLLTRAIDVLSPLINKKCLRYTVYRGQGCYPVADVGQKYQFRRFTSTTFNPKVALAFSSGQCTTFIKIEDAYGLPVEKFSNFKTEEEVILRSDSVFLVYNKLNSTADKSVKENITNEMKNILGTQHSFYSLPDIFVHLIMEENTMKKKRSAEETNDDYSLETHHIIRTTREATEMIIDEIDLWKQHLHSNYDGKDSVDVPKCIAKSTVSSSVPTTPGNLILIVFLAVTFLVFFAVEIFS